MASSSRYQGLDHPTSSLRGQDELAASQLVSSHPDAYAGGASRAGSSLQQGASPHATSGVKRRGDDGLDDRSMTGSPSSELLQMDDADPSEPSKRARLSEPAGGLHPPPSTPFGGASSSASPAAGDPASVSPVVLGFQMSATDPTTRDTVRHALQMKEQQQALILQRREGQKTAAAEAAKAGDGTNGREPATAGSADEGDEGGRKSAGSGKAGGLSIKTSGPSLDGGMRSAPLLSGGQGYPSSSRQGSARYGPTRTDAFYGERSVSASGAPISASRTPSGSYARPSGTGYANGHGLTPLASPGYPQQHAFAGQQQAGAAAGRHGGPPAQAPYAGSPPSPPSAHKAAFLAPFEKFYDALLDSRTLQASQVALEHKTAELHRQAGALVHTLEEHHRRSASVLGTLQASSASLQDMVRSEVAVVRDEARRELDAVRRRVDQLEEGLRDAGLEPPAPLSGSTDDGADEAGIPAADGKRPVGKPPARKSASAASTPRKSGVRK